MIMITCYNSQIPKSESTLSGYFRLHISYGNQTDQGRVRTSNEDSHTASGRHKLFLVADGMGGHAGGEVASQIAATTIEEMVAKAGDDVAQDDILRKAAQEANTRIFQTQRENAELAGMGSTLTALHFRDEQYSIAHVGDSRAYLLRDGVLDQLTRDHSLVWQLFESGALKKEELSGHPQKNLITRSIGPHSEIDLDVERGKTRHGDVFLLCSDGLTDVVPDEKIRATLFDSEKSPQQMCTSLINQANEAGGPDNITVVIVRIHSEAPVEDETIRL